MLIFILMIRVRKDKNMNWLNLHTKLGKQLVAKMHDQVYFLDNDGNKHYLQLNFDEKVKPYFTENSNKETKKEECSSSFLFF